METQTPAPAPEPEIIPTAPVDITHAARAVHLVRLPEPLANLWTRCGASKHLGSLNFHPKPGRSPDVSLVVNADLAREVLTEEEAKKTPLQYHLQTYNTQVVGNRLFSTDADGASQVKIDGLVKVSGHFRPRRDLLYKRRLQDRKRKAAHDPKFRRRTRLARTKIRRNDEFVGFKIDEERKRETEQLPSFSDVHSAFDFRQYWTMKELLARVTLPDAEIKSAVKSMCNYLNAGPHRQNYELKPEYRGTTHPEPTEAPLA